MTQIKVTEEPANSKSPEAQEKVKADAGKEEKKDWGDPASGKRKRSQRKL